MRRTEQKLWDRMRSNLLTAPIRLERIENLVGAGIPDVLVLASGIVTWCELKAVAAPPVRSTTRVLGGTGLSVEQRNWHSAWRKHGGRSCVVVGIGSIQLFVISGVYADSVNAWTLAELHAHNIAATWSELEAYLRGGQS